jgi:hypothetical protein
MVAAESSAPAPMPRPATSTKRAHAMRRKQMANDVEQRIRERAFKIWIEEGQPEGRDKDHWELAKFAIAEQDGQAATLVPAAAPQPEPIEAVKNQGEFPTLTDQGEPIEPVQRNEAGSHPA